MGDYKDLYSEVRKRKLEALNKKEIVKAVEKHGKILAFEGEYEKPKDVIGNMYASERKMIKRKKIEKKIWEIDFNRFDLILIGCSGKTIPTAAYKKIKNYVENGGWILTTDWAIVHIIENIFPGYIKWNQEKTDDAVVSCQIVQPNHPFLDGLLSELSQSKWKNKKTKKEEFRWWLENKSFPIDVQNPQVKVLISSLELKKKWGSEPVLVYFNYGKNDGRVIHMISHTHLQKGGQKGKYASALILTNILDEKISQKMGLTSPQSKGYVSEWESQKSSASQGSQSHSDEVWITPEQDNNYVTPSNVGGDIGLTGTSQIVEIDPSSPEFSYASKCPHCGYDFGDYDGKVFMCKECGASYHKDCLERQISKGECKKCGKILLW
ncbi:MAG: hypothetical protein BAJALOKI2v1_720008 [Promethearchaeota archaeon]|nr:MAG: hypothetical protein BAJALOKI2v1_720008 [Candidatus Lokiarchaeota archaeon]